MKLSLTNGYELDVDKSGVFIRKNKTLMYYNKAPIYVSVKNRAAVSAFGDVPYQSVEEKDGRIYADGEYVSGNGSVFLVSDVYEIVNDSIRISREATVSKAAEDDLGFYTKIGLWSAASAAVEDYFYFSPGQWYRHNEYAGDNAMGKDMTAQYYWKKETRCGLPMFSAQNIDSGETITFSRWASDVTLKSVDRVESENYVDPLSTAGSLGISVPAEEILLYTYYNADIRIPYNKASAEGLSIDYVYPGGYGEMPEAARGPVCPGKPRSFSRINHPVEEGFSQKYSIAVDMACYKDFRIMMRETWRKVYPRLKDRLADISNEKLYHNNMKLLKKVVYDYGQGIWGTPFAAQLPQFDPNSSSAEMGFVGQQTGIGYQLLRWGVLEDDAEAAMKGRNIIEFWTSLKMTEGGGPVTWYHLGAGVQEPQPQWLREATDGLEAVADAWSFADRHGEKHDNWLDYCVACADWLTGIQNENGSYYRSYNRDGSPCMDSESNTPCAVGFLLRMYRITGKEEYRNAAVKAGEWSFIHLYENMEYKGGTCDNLNIMDKEAGLYALFAFMGLYELNDDKRWLEAAAGAADYVETMTYIWSFPVFSPYPALPLARNHVSGQSTITVGNPGADVYLACAGYTYFKLYLYTGDEHYLDYAEFVHINSKQANDVDGSFGYAIPGLVHEGADFSDQIFRGHYHWLPWCTFVEVDPVSRLYDDFGAYEIKDAVKMHIKPL